MRSSGGSSMSGFAVLLVCVGHQDAVLDTPLPLDLDSLNFAFAEPHSDSLPLHREDLCSITYGQERILLAGRRHGHYGDRKSVVSGKSVSVRVDVGGRGIIKKKIK